jgi:hypothetical protein
MLSLKRKLDIETIDSKKLRLDPTPSDYIPKESFIQTSRGQEKNPYNDAFR